MRARDRGQDTEIDKFLIERMMDPILHLVRNAVSHGLETIAERRAAGKTDEGHAHAERRQPSATWSCIEIADDGRGHRRGRASRRARRRGGPGGPRRAARADDALLDILCAPGFSTRDAADRGSGRGVGMAVVADHRRRSSAER